MSEGALNNPNYILALEEAVKQKKKVVLVHDTSSKFPQPSEIDRLSPEVKNIFTTVAVPLIAKYVKEAWKKIADKLFDRIQVSLHFSSILTKSATKSNGLVFKSQTANWTKNIT